MRRSGLNFVRGGLVIDLVGRVLVHVDAHFTLREIGRQGIACLDRDIVVLDSVAVVVTGFVVKTFRDEVARQVAVLIDARQMEHRQRVAVEHTVEGVRTRDGLHFQDFQKQTLLGIGDHDIN